MEVSLHATPRWRDVLFEQIRVVGLGLRPAALVIAAVLGFGTFVIGVEIAGGGPGFDSYETFPTPLIAFLFPFAVWRNDKRFGAAFFRTLPVDRRRLALAKAFAGLLWFAAALAFFALWLLTLGFLAHAPAENTVARVPVIAAIAAYLFGSALLLGLRHPLRWLLGVGGVLFVMGTLGDLLSRPDDREWRYVPGARAFFSAVEQAGQSWMTLPDLAQWAITTFLLLGAGLAALWAAASRHVERRRH